jgi:co-chaperonin GroES (HSP10)
MKWRQFRPIREWVVVKADPRVKATSGGIVLPEQLLGVERVMEGTGRILKVGNRDDIRKTTGGVDLEPGMRICFRGFLKDAYQEFDKDEDGQIVFLLHSKDVLAVVSDDVKLGYIT